MAMNSTPWLNWLAMSTTWAGVVFGSSAIGTAMTAGHPVLGLAILVVGVGALALGLIAIRRLV